MKFEHAFISRERLLLDGTVETVIVVAISALLSGVPNVNYLAFGTPNTTKTCLMRYVKCQIILTFATVYSTNGIVLSKML